MPLRLLPLLSVALLSLATVTALIQPCFAAANTPENICRYLESDSKGIDIPGGYLKKDKKKANRFIFAFVPIKTTGLSP